MGLDGYVGTAEDARRIMRQEKQREEQRKKYEALKKQSDANVDAAGLRQFGAAKTEVPLPRLPIHHSFQKPACSNSICLPAPYRSIWMSSLTTFPLVVRASRPSYEGRGCLRSRLGWLDELKVLHKRRSFPPSFPTLSPPPSPLSFGGRSGETSLAHPNFEIGQ